MYLYIKKKLLFTGRWVIVRKWGGSLIGSMTHESDVEDDEGVEG